MTRLAIASLLILALAACDSEPAGKTATKLDAVEVQPGTISDSMIILDNATADGTAVDNSVPDDGTAKPAEQADETDGDEDAAADDGEESGDDAVAPVAKKATTPGPTKQADDE